MNSLPIFHPYAYSNFPYTTLTTGNRVTSNVQSTCKIPLVVLKHAKMCSYFHLYIKAFHILRPIVLFVNFETIVFLLYITRVRDRHLLKRTPIIYRNFIEKKFTIEIIYYLITVINWINTSSITQTLKLFFALPIIMR